MASRRLVLALLLISFACLCSGGRVKREVCVIGGKTYKAGQSFIDEGCTGQCTCHAGGSVSCVSLCPPSRVACLPGQVESTKQVPVGSEGRCFCTVPTCVKAQKCVIGGKTYNAGQSFIDEGCTGQCTCDEGGGISCVSLCPPSHVACPPGETKSTKKEPVGSEGRCFCTVPICVKA